MEIEKSVFRVHERILESQGYQAFINICFKGFLIASIFFTMTFISVMLIVHNDDSLIKIMDQYIKNYSNSEQFLMDSQLNIVFGTFKPEFQNEKYIFRNQTNIDDIKFRNNSIDNNLNSIIQQLNVQLNVSDKYQIQMLSHQLKNDHNFTQHNIFINSDKYYKNELAQFVIDKIIDSEDYLVFQLSLIMKRMKIGRLFIKSKQNNLYDISNSSMIKLPLSIRLSSLSSKILRILLALFLISNVTAIYSRITLITAPIIILQINVCFRQRDIQQRFLILNISRAFPWIGTYIIRQYNSSSNLSFTNYFKLAMFCTLVLFYCLYIAVTLLLTRLVFENKYQKDLADNFFGFFAMCEFMSYILMRTRSSIKYFPIFTIQSSFLFLLNYQMTDFGFYQLQMNMLVTLGMTCFLMLLKYIEIEALSWPTNQRYKPDQERPRIMYFPYFSTNMINDLPQIWSIFYPLHSGAMFSEYQMSWIHQNYLSLNIYANTLNGNSLEMQQQNQEQLNIQQENQQL